MTALGAPLFADGAFTGPAWDLVRRQMAPPERAPSLEDVRDELAVRDAVARYFYAFDQGDLEATLAMFTDDCVLTSAGGTARGRHAVRERYEEMIRASSHRFHHIANQVVRLSADRLEALVTSYHHAVLESTSGAPRAVGGVVADRMVKTVSGWKFAARTTSIDYSFELPPTR